MQTFDKVCKSCRSRQELSNERFFKIGFDTAEYGPLKVCQKIVNSSIKTLGLRRGGAGTGGAGRSRLRSRHGAAARVRAAHVVASTPELGSERPIDITIEKLKKILSWS